MKAKVQIRSCLGLVLRVRLRTASVAAATTIVLLLAMLGASSAQAQTYRVIYKFAGGTDGANPMAGLVREGAGGFSGTTTNGGALGFGTVFTITSTGKETMLYSFTGTPDGALPYGGLARDAAGNLYGTTHAGGGAGTVFEVDTAGREAVLYSFSSGGEDGKWPSDGLLRDAAGNLYGTTSGGGHFGPGTVFELAVSGMEKVLHSFGGAGDGASPYGGLVRDASGNFYGTTVSGGALGLGTVFKLATNGKETVLHSFTGGADGRFPFAALTIDGAGNLYGTAFLGGEYDSGVVFKVDTAANETVLYSFTGGADGGFPYAAVILDTAGNLYGTTYTGGNSPSCISTGTAGCGTVFELDAAGAETVLHSFGGGDGSNPFGGLVMDEAGNLYGATAYGGNFACALGCGVLYAVKR